MIRNKNVLSIVSVGDTKSFVVKTVDEIGIVTTNMEDLQRSTYARIGQAQDKWAHTNKLSLDI